MVVVARNDKGEINQLGEVSVDSFNRFEFKEAVGKPLYWCPNYSGVSVWPAPSPNWKIYKLVMMETLSLNTAHHNHRAAIRKHEVDQ